MTSSKFLSLYYTDCRPGQGLRGGAGFQFQSVSTGVGHDAMTLVQRSALYEAPVAWMREHRAVDSYPHSLTHMFDGMYVTARGVYLGAEANGVREGNQFTHAVTTLDPDTYGLIRPAQLWDAPWWSAHPAPTTECDPIPAQPEQGPWGIDAIREWVLGQPDAEDWLIAVSSAFDRAQEPNRGRVLFVGADAATILGWIAAGTILLPQPRALRLGFRVFALNPQYSQHDVLGLHPDWAGSYADVDRNGEFVVFNLSSGKHSAVDHTDAAAYWAPRFLRLDPFDVVDAIELAHEFAWQRHRIANTSAVSADARTGSADLLVSAVVTLGETVRHEQEASALVGWLARQPAPVVDDIVEPVTRAVLAASPDASTLGELDGAVWLHGLRGRLAGQVRANLLAAEVEEIMTRRRTTVEAKPLPPHNLSSAEQLANAAVIEQAATRIPPDQMDLLLRTSMRFDVTPDVPKFLDAAHRFVTWWADNPSAGLDPSTWPEPDPRTMLIDQLRDELARRASSSGFHETVRRHWWRLLLPIRDPGSPLDASVAAAAMEHGDPRTQHDVFQAVLGFAQRSNRPDTGDLVWDALFRYVPPRTEQLVDLLPGLRSDTTSKTFATQVLTALAQHSGPQVTYAKLIVLDRLASLGWNPTDSRLADLRRQDIALQRWLAAAAARKPDQAGDEAAGLHIVTEMVFRARRSEVVRALLDTLPLADSWHVMNCAGDHLRRFLFKELSPLWNDRANNGHRGDKAVALTIAIIAAKPKPLPHEPAMDFHEWNSRIDAERLRRVTELLDNTDPELSQYYHQDYRRQLEKSLNIGRKKKGSTPEDDPGPKVEKSRWSLRKREKK